MSKVINVTVWNEFLHELDSSHPAYTIYPDGMHTVIADYLNKQSDIKAGTATLREPEHGLTDEVLANNDVLIWWGHAGHQEVSDEVVDKVHKRVLAGMGLIVLHSGHLSKIFTKLLGTSCFLKWREAREKERLWVIEPSHPIVQGIGEYFELPEEEMYGERFDIPKPDELVLTSWFAGGEVFRSGCCWTRGMGRIFYFRPGHESHPTFYDANVLKVIENAIRWSAPSEIAAYECSNPDPLEKIQYK